MEINPGVAHSNGVLRTLYCTLELAIQYGLSQMTQ